jgi:putative transposase
VVHAFSFPLDQYVQSTISIARLLCVRVGLPMIQTTALNQEWALDFAHDAIATGRSIRVLSVIDTHTRECLALEVDTSFASRRVTRVLDRLR